MSEKSFCPALQQDIVRLWTSAKIVEVQGLWTLVCSEAPATKGKEVKHLGNAARVEFIRHVLKSDSPIDAFSVVIAAASKTKDAAVKGGGRHVAAQGKGGFSGGMSGATPITAR